MVKGVILEPRAAVTFLHQCKQEKTKIAAGYNHSCFSIGCACEGKAREEFFVQVIGLTLVLLNSIFL